MNIYLRNRDISSLLRVKTRVRSLLVFVIISGNFALEVAFFSTDLGRSSWKLTGPILVSGWLLVPSPTRGSQLVLGNLSSSRVESRHNYPDWKFRLMKEGDGLIACFVSVLAFCGSAITDSDGLALVKQIHGACMYHSCIPGMSDYRLQFFLCFYFKSKGNKWMSRKGNTRTLGPSQ